MLLVVKLRLKWEREGEKRRKETRKERNERKGEKVAAAKETANWDGRREKAEEIGTEQNLLSTIFSTRTSCCGDQAKTGLFVSLFPNLSLLPCPVLRLKVSAVKRERKENLSFGDPNLFGFLSSLDVVVVWNFWLLLQQFHHSSSYENEREREREWERERLSQDVKLSAFPYDPVSRTVHWLKFCRIFKTAQIIFSAQKFWCLKMKRMMMMITQDDDFAGNKLLSLCYSHLFTPWFTDTTADNNSTSLLFQFPFKPRPVIREELKYTLWNANSFDDSLWNANSFHDSLWNANSFDEWFNFSPR